MLLSHLREKAEKMAKERAHTLNPWIVRRNSATTSCKHCRGTITIRVKVFNSLPQIKGILRYTSCFGER